MHIPTSNSPTNSNLKYNNKITHIAKPGQKSGFSLI